MAPGSNKRKRPERLPSQDDGSNRPSPHRPETLGMAHQNHGSATARGGRGGRRPNIQGAHSPGPVGTAVSVTSRNAASPISQSVAQQQRETPAADSPRPATPAQTNQMPAKFAAEGEGANNPPTPYIYDYVTELVAELWPSHSSEFRSAVNELDEMCMSIAVQELIRAGLDGRLDAGEAGSTIRHIILDQAEKDGVDVQSLFLNLLSLLDDADMKNSSLPTLVAATNIDPNMIRQELDVPLLQNISMVRFTFDRMRTRKTTNILYRQANFNLLREESEGYAKLVTEYFNTANEAVLNPNVSAEDAFQRVMALVGSFDLDVGRVLDITLDISANLLVRAYGFFVKFYRCSSWWPEADVLDNVKWEDQGFNSFPNWAMPGYDQNVPLDIKNQQDQQFASMKEARDVKFWVRVREVGTKAFFEIGARKIVDYDSILPLLETVLPAEHDSKKNEINADRRKRINENRKFMRQTGTLPPQGNSDAAQLLGFKLRFYASTARDAADVLPENLVYLAALLIKIGFISLRDLYPHLYPSDEQMSDEKSRLDKEKREKEAKDRPGRGTNALLMAGALPDDTTPVGRNLREKERNVGSVPKAEKKDEELKEELPAPTNQKILLLKALLLVGALPEALYILGRFPWLADVDISLPPYLHRVVNHMLSKVGDSLKPLDSRTGLQDSEKELKDDKPTSGSLRFSQRAPKKITRWLGLDQVDKQDGQTYRHYYPDWEDNIPICQNVEDVFLLCNTFLGFLGVKIGQDAALLGTLVRIAKKDLVTDGSDRNRGRWLELMKRLLVPALSLSKHNPGLTQEVFELLNFFPASTRYVVYSEWFRGRTSRLPDMRVALDRNKAEVKEVLRRVSNETGKKQARALARVSLSSPGVVMMSMIDQLETYSNMIPSLVECTRYFSGLAWDVLTWCLINSLGGRGRDRMQADGMLTSPWLQALSQFVASLFLRMPVIDPTPVLQFLTAELRAGNSTDLELFEQILTEMAGIKSEMGFNDAQVLAMAGGECLQAQIVLQLGDKRYVRKTSAQRLMNALAQPRLTGQILISIAQEWQMYSHHESSKDMPLKVLGNNIDKVQSIFGQYLEVLKTNLTPTEFEDSVPDIVSLVRDFGIQPGVAFTICRFVIVNRIAETDAAKKSESDEKRHRLSQEKVNADVGMYDNELQKSSTNSKKPFNERPPQLGPREGEENDGTKLTEVPHTSAPSASRLNEQPWHSVLQPIIHKLPEAAPHLAGRVSIPFFVTFWTLTLQDILVHTPSYDKEINKLRDEILLINKDKNDVTALTLKERNRKKEAAAEIQDNLRGELKGRIAAYQKTRNRLSRREKDHWFSRVMEKEDIDARHIGLLQECFLPRTVLSALDAHYCFLMLKMLHDNGTPGFSTMHLLNHLFRKQELASIMFQCTSMEAQHFGRFLCEILKLLQHWHADKAVFEKEALGGKQKLPGFAKKLDANGEPESVLEFEEFRRLLFNWHSFLNGALQMCFESGEYMHIRNGIIVLRSVVQIFPALNFMGHNMVKHATRLSKEDPRQDLKLAAMSLLGPLRSREKNWMMPQAFRLNDPTKESARPSSGAPSTRGETPQSSTDTPRLNGAATEFKPPSATITNGFGRKESVIGPEDGEIDEKQAAGRDGDIDMKDAPTNASAQDHNGQPEDDNLSDEAGPKVEQHTTATNNQQQSSKPASPAPAFTRSPPSATGPVRTHPSRTASTRPAPYRPAHALPTRPEYATSSKTFSESAPERGGRYGGRSEDRYGRLDRPNELRPASREHSPGGRIGARTPEREPYGRVPLREERVPPRDDRGPSRNYRDDDYQSSRREQASSASRDRVNGFAMPPAGQNPRHDKAAYANPAATGPATSRPVFSEVSSGTPSQSESHYHENPARMALIKEDQGRDGVTHSVDTSTEPRRLQEQRDDSRFARPDTRTGERTNLLDPSHDSQNRVEEPSELAPTGPKRERGRLSRDTGAAQQESSYGRLNAPQDFQGGGRTPHGPSTRGGRNFTAPQFPPGGRPNEVSLSSSSAIRQSDPPAAFRGPNMRQPTGYRNSVSQFERPSFPNSASGTPASETGPSVHPSRLAHVNTSPAPIQTNVPPNGSRNMESPTSAAPAGPRGPHRPSAGANNLPSPGNHGPPVGPVSVFERQKRGDRQRADINATLQNAGNGTEANGQVVSFRGAAQNRHPSTVQPSANQPVSAIASPIDPPPRRSDNVGRSELRNDLFHSRVDRTVDGEDRGGNRPPKRRDDEWSERHRGSRNPSHERRPEDQMLQRPPPFGMDGDKRRTRDEREIHEGPRDRRGPERQPRGDDMRRAQDGPGPFATGFGQPASEWERGEGRGPRRDGFEDSRRGGRHSGRAEDFRGANRDTEKRDGGRGPRDDAEPPGLVNRKRRHDEAPLLDDSKRRRSGR